MSDWKEIEDTNQDCGDSNGWCYCWRCLEHSQWLHKQAEWEEQEYPEGDGGYY